MCNRGWASNANRFQIQQAAPTPHPQRMVRRVHLHQPTLLPSFLLPEGDTPGGNCYSGKQRPSRFQGSWGNVCADEGTAEWRRESQARTQPCLHLSTTSVTWKAKWHGQGALEKVRTHIPFLQGRAFSSVQALCWADHCKHFHEGSGDWRA